MNISRIQTLLFLLAILALSSCKHGDDDKINLDDELQIVLEENAENKDVNFFLQPSSDDYTNIPQDPKNPITSEKVALGKLLFHETALGVAPMQDISKGTYSCASCHFAQAGFQAGRFQGIGEGGIGFGQNGEGRVANADYEEVDLDVQPLRSPTILNVAYQKLMLWNGQFGSSDANQTTDAYWTPGTPLETNNLGFEGVETQAIAGLGVHRLAVPQIVEDYPEYKTMFDDAFGNISEDIRYSKVNAGLAIAAYERTVFPNEAPFQKYLKGNKSALTENQKLGAMVFFEKGQCGTCHTGPSLNKMIFSALGTGDLLDCGELTFKTPEDDPANLGRGGFTQDVADNYKFKVPQLYNLKDSPFYFHGASAQDLKQVVEYKNNAVAQNSRVPVSKLDPLFKPLNLSNTEIDQLVDFIENGLHDADLMRYVPGTLPSGNCFPMNDETSQTDLGCN